MVKNAKTRTIIEPNYHQITTLQLSFYLPKDTSGTRYGSCARHQTRCPATFAKARQSGLGQAGSAGATYASSTTTTRPATIPAHDGHRTAASNAAMVQCWTSSRFNGAQNAPTCCSTTPGATATTTTTNAAATTYAATAGHQAPSDTAPDDWSTSDPATTATASVCATTTTGSDHDPTAAANSAVNAAAATTTAATTTTTTTTTTDAASAADSNPIPATCSAHATPPSAPDCWKQEESPGAVVERASLA